MPHTPIGLLSYAVFMTSCAIATWRGRGLERATAGILAFMCVLTPFIQDHVHYDDPREFIYLTNLPQLIWLLGVALWVGRRWMLFAAAFEILCTATEVGHDLVRRFVGAWVYLSVLIAWSWGVYLSLLAGGLSARRGGAPADESGGSDAVNP